MLKQCEESEEILHSNECINLWINKIISENSIEYDKVIFLYNKYAEDFIKNVSSFFKNIENKELIKIKWDDSQFLTVDIINKVDKIDLESSLLFIVREPIENLRKLLRNGYNLNNIIKANSEWIHFIEKKLKLTNCSVIVDFPSNSRASLDKNNLNKNFSESFWDTFKTSPDEMNILIKSMTRILKKSQIIKIIFDGNYILSLNLRGLNLNEDSLKIDKKSNTVNLPCGEVFFGYEKINNINGIFQSKYDGKFIINNGIIIDVSLPKYKNYINGNIIEFGIGINKNATTNSYDSVAEKAKGTVHIGIIPSNQDEKNIKHIDIISDYCNIYIDNKII